MMSNSRRGQTTWARLLLGLLGLWPGVNFGQPELLSVSDIGMESGFQGYWDNHYRRGRAIVSHDFDGDGYVDYFVGNPGDESLIYRNEGPGPDGLTRFVPAQILLQGDLASVASGADYDNDGDLDLFVGCGGVEGICLDFLFRNDSVPGRIRFTDVSLRAGIRDPVRPFLDEDPGKGPEVPWLHATGGGTWGDYDQDGDQDLFVSVSSVDWEVFSHRNVLWRNNDDGTFTDITVSAGLAYSGPYVPGDWALFQNSTWIDADNDGDLDLFLNNARGPNILYRNLLAETARPRFVDDTEAFSLPAGDLRLPLRSFASAVADFNNDGWQDLILFAVGLASSSTSRNGLLLNRSGQGFYNVASLAGINTEEGEPEVAMGCQVADLNADGIPDLVIGAGEPSTGVRNRLLLSRRLDGDIPQFDDASALIDFEPPHGIDPASSPYPEIPAYPYRSHGISAADFDGDGHLEVGIVNGGPANAPALVREPDRLFRFAGPGLGNVFRAHLRGNGLSDSRDAIGARAYVEIDSTAGKRRVFQTVLAGSGFSAQNEGTLTFGLGNDTGVSRLAILWPSGCLQMLDAPTQRTSSTIVVDQVCWTCPNRPGPVEAWLEPDLHSCSPPAACRLEGTISDGIGPVPWTRVLHIQGEPPTLASESRSDQEGNFLVEHAYEPGFCQTSVLEPFGYLPISNPIKEEGSISGVETLDVLLSRGPEGRWPRGKGYWRHQTRSLFQGRGHSHAHQSEIEAWLKAIRDRYPGLEGFDSLQVLAETFMTRPTGFDGDHLRQHLAAALLNLASGRLSSFTILASGDRVGDLVEEAYRRLARGDVEPTEVRTLAARLEALNRGLLFR